MGTIKRDVVIVVEFKRGASMIRLAKKYKLKPQTIERIVRNWMIDFIGIANRSIATLKFGRL